MSCKDCEELQKTIDALDSRLEDAEAFIRDLQDVKDRTQSHLDDAHDELSRAKSCVEDAMRKLEDAQ